MINIKTQNEGKLTVPERQEEPEGDVLSGALLRAYWQSTATKYREVIGLEAQVKRYERVKGGDISVPED